MIVLQANNKGDDVMTYFYRFANKEDMQEAKEAHNDNGLISSEHYQFELNTAHAQLSEVVRKSMARFSSIYS